MRCGRMHVRIQTLVYCLSLIVGEYAGDIVRGVGWYRGLVGEYDGEVGEYRDVGEYEGEVGEYDGLAGE